MRRSVIRLVESARNRLQYALATEDPGEWYTGGRYSDRMDEQLLLNVYMYVCMCVRMRLFSINMCLQVWHDRDLLTSLRIGGSVRFHFILNLLFAERSIKSLAIGYDCIIHIARCFFSVLSTNLLKGTFNGKI